MKNGKNVAGDFQNEMKDKFNKTREIIDERKEKITAQMNKELEEELKNKVSQEASERFKNASQEEKDAMLQEAQQQHARKRYGKAIFIIIMVLLAAVFAYFAYRRITTKKKVDTKEIPTVHITKMKKGDIKKEGSVVGVISSQDIYNVIPKVSGEITKVYIENGDIVKKDDKICEIDNSKAIDAAKISYDTAASTFRRISKLYQSGDVSKQEYETVKAQYDGAKLSYDTQVEYSTIVSPGEGTIENADLTVHTMVSAGTPLCTVTSHGAKIVEFSLGERMVNGVNVGDEVRVEKSGEKYKAIVYDKQNLLQQSTGMFPFKATIQSDHNFSSGVRCKVAVIYDQKHNIDCIDKALIYYDNEKPYVFVVTPENKIKKTFIQVGIENDVLSEVVSGLKNDDRILSTWSNDIMDGVSVKVVE